MIRLFPTILAPSLPELEDKIQADIPPDDASWFISIVEDSGTFFAEAHASDGGRLLGYL